MILKAELVMPPVEIMEIEARVADIMFPLASYNKDTSVNLFDNYTLEYKEGKNATAPD